ncbi:unnamed protein product [Oncorhynchus mykiss]|uniref:Enolase N-terminal domain-containing protein n=1 Tax=Oncorhynchus mykiss TaxID=8022 RepID=A0A060Z907_ONCMY|nr:unnamed protein product [Oncorhynchus mykiss]
MSILKIHAREIFDSRGNPTVEVDLYTDKGKRCYRPNILLSGPLCSVGRAWLLQCQNKTFSACIHFKSLWISVC